VPVFGENVVAFVPAATAAATRPAGCGCDGDGDGDSGSFGLLTRLALEMIERLLWYKPLSY